MDASNERNGVYEIGTSRRGAIWSEFYIEVLGSLVPGLFSLIVSIAVLSLSFLSLSNALLEPNAELNPRESIDLGLGAYGVTIILLVAAYVLGSIFYRQDPAVPDYRSANWVYRNTDEAERARLAVQPTEDYERGADLKPEDVHFPYLFIYEYLKGRGLDHLAQWIPWKGGDSDTWRDRTKIFINQIKIRLQFLVPERCTEIVRNEAHVRLATSVWYAARWIIWVCVIGLIVLGCALWLRPAIQSDYLQLASASVIGVSFGFSVYLKRSIERFLHYLRVREIIYVLELAHVAEANGFDVGKNEIAGYCGSE